MSFTFRRRRQRGPAAGAVTPRRQPCTPRRRWLCRLAEAPALAEASRLLDDLSGPYRSLDNDNLGRAFRAAFAAGHTQLGELLGSP